MDYFSAAVAVLEQAKEPLTVGEITERAIQRGYLAPAGKTPAATMSARLYLACRGDPRCPIERLAQPGAARAVRGTVRWKLRAS